MFHNLEFTDTLIQFHTDTHVGTANADDFKTWIIVNGKNKFMHEKQNKAQTDVDQKEFMLSYDQILQDRDLRESLFMEFLKANGKHD